MKKWLTTTIFTLWKWIKFIPFIFTGRGWPTAYVDRADGAYASFTKAEMDAAEEYANTWMLDNGYLVGAYTWRGNDCDDYSFIKAAMMRHYLQINFPARLKAEGKPVGLFGYVRDSDKAPHQIVQVIIIGGNRAYYSAYAESKHAGGKTLSKTEVGSKSFDIF